MEEVNDISKWTSGVVLALAGLVWGIASLASHRLVIPFLRLNGFPLTHDIPVRGAPAVLISLALIWFSLYLHFSYFWSRSPKFGRFANGASQFTGWAATGFFVSGLGVWIFSYSRHGA